jgi:hypothetical protein
LGNKVYRTWAKFVKEVEDIFGITHDQLEEQFFALAPKPQETSPSFVLRVETERRRLDIDKSSTFHAFVKRNLDLGLRQKLDQIRWSKKTQGNLKFGWDDVVAVCRDMASGCALGEAAAEAAVPVKTTTLYSNRSATENAAREDRKCDLCSRLGMGGDSHSREWCYIDPRSKAYKPEVRQRRVAQAKARGVPIPPELLIEDKGKS